MKETIYNQRNSICAIKKRKKKTSKSQSIIELRSKKERREGREIKPFGEERSDFGGKEGKQRISRGID